MPGHWEGDLISDSGGVRIGTLVERTTRFTMLLHLPRMPGHGDERRGQERARTAPAMAPKPCVTPSRPAIATLPEQLRRSLTWDQGAEMAQHAKLRIETGPRRSTSATRSPRGSAAPTRTPTVSSASTSRRAPIQPGTPEADSRRSLLALNGRPAKDPRLEAPPPRPSTNTYTRLGQGSVATTP